MGDFGLRDCGIARMNNQTTATRQEAQEQMGGMEDTGNSARGVSRAVQGRGKAESGLICACGRPLEKKRRGPAPRICRVCRRSQEREARRIGRQVIARRTAPRRSRRPTYKLTAAEARQVAALIAIGSVAIGRPIPPSPDLPISRSPSQPEAKR